MKTIIEITFFILISLYRINFIGSFSLGDIYIIIISFTLLNQTNWKNEDIRKITFYYLIYLIIQIITEAIIGNQFENTIKGIAVTVLSYLTFLFFYDRIKKKYIVLLILLVGEVLKVFTNNSIEGWNVFDMPVFKFKIGIIILNILLIVSYFLIIKKKNNILFTLLLFFGVVFIALDSRSNGLILITTAFIYYIYLKKVTLKRIILIMIVSTFSLYSIYVTYIDNVLNQNFAGQHTYNQVSNLKNPYNPIELFSTGRSELNVAFQAMIDEPFTGHGAWARDKNGKYRRLQASHSNFEDERQMNNFLNSDKDGLPTHSVIFGAGAYNGVFAFIIVSIIIIFFIRRGVSALKNITPFSVILIYSILMITWNSLFSPLPHFRFSLPLFFSICFIMSELYKEMRINKLKKKYKNYESIRAQNYSRNRLQS